MVLHCWQDLGVRKHVQAFKLMAIIRDTDPEHWDKLEENGDVPEVDITSELPCRALPINCSC
jgi:hypothetical protein